MLISKYEYAIHRYGHQSRCQRLPAWDDREAERDEYFRAKLTLLIRFESYGSEFYQVERISLSDSLSKINWTRRLERCGRAPLWQGASVASVQASCLASISNIAVQAVPHAGAVLARYRSFCLDRSPNAHIFSRHHTFYPHWNPGRSAIHKVNACVWVQIPHLPATERTCWCKFKVRTSEVFLLFSAIKNAFDI